MKPTSPHSNVTSLANQKPKFKKYLTFETASTLTEAKHLANDIAETYRYAYRAKALLAGHADVKVGHVIYLDNLDHGMSGYWTVLSVTHLFGSGNASYQLDVTLGCDVLGDTDPAAKTQAEVRDFDSEFSGKSLFPSNSILSDYSNAVATGTPEGPKLPTPTSKNVPSAYAPSAPTEYTTDLYQDDVPDFSSINRMTTWRATNGI
jgi:hypothetical protein